MSIGAYSTDEVLRRVSALGLTTRKGKPVSRQTFHMILRNPLYAGWVKSGDLLVKGVHEPIVSQKLFDDVQYVLGENSRTAQPRQVVNAEFPLRQWVRCAACGKGLTGAVVKAKGLSYYFCYKKGCRSVLVRKELLETRFLQILGMLQPTYELLQQLPEIAKRQWAAREQRVRQEQKSLKGRIVELKRLNLEGIKAKMRGELTQEDFESLKASNLEEIERLEKQVTSLESEISTVQQLISESEKELVDFQGAWKRGGINEKRELQTALFPDGLAFDATNGFLNHKNRQIMADLLAALREFQSASGLASPAGFEPALPP